MFCKLIDNEIVCTDVGVYSKDYILLPKDKDIYQYPVDGWSWYETKEDAEKI
jgi:hypothetical protein